MIRRVFTEVRAGYRYPDPADYGASYGLLLLPNDLEAMPTPVERVRRAARWGWAEVRTILSERIHPDG